MSVPGIGPMMCSPRVATLPPGWGSFQNRSRPGIAPSSARYPDVATVTCGFCSARVVLIKPKIGSAKGKPWIQAARKRLHHNVLAKALANKLARIAWSVLAASFSGPASPTHNICYLSAGKAPASAKNKNAGS